MATSTLDAGASTSAKPSLTDLRNRKLGSVAEEAPMAQGLGGSSSVPLPAAAGDKLSTSASAPPAVGAANGAAAADGAAAAAEGEEAAPAPEPYAPIKRSPPKATLTLDQLLLVLVGSCQLVSALLLAWFKPSAWVWAKWGLIGMAAGLVYSFLYFKNQRSKAEINTVVRRRGPARSARGCTAPALRAAALRGRPSAAGARARSGRLTAHPRPRPGPRS
jgi:hypothetical protein